MYRWALFKSIFTLLNLVSPELYLSLAIPVDRVVRLLVCSWWSQSIELPDYPIQRTKFNLIINHDIGLLKLDTAHCDFIENTLHEVYLNILTKIWIKTI